MLFSFFNRIVERKGEKIMTGSKICLRIIIFRSDVYFMLLMNELLSYCWRLADRTLLARRNGDRSGLPQVITLCYLVQDPDYVAVAVADPLNRWGYGSGSVLLGHFLNF